MKKYLFLLFLLVLCVFLCSCKGDEIDPLGYQSYPFYVEGVLVTEETDYDFALKMNSADSSEIMFTKPDSLRNYVFRVTPEGTTLSYGDMTINFNGGEKTNLIRLIPSLFSLKKEGKVSQEEKEFNSIAVLVCTYSTDVGEVKMYLNAEKGTPLRFEGEDFTLNVTSFTPEGAAVPDETPFMTPTPIPQNTPSAED